MERDNDSPADPEAPASAPTGKACGASAVDSAVDPTPSHRRDTALLDPQPQATARALPAAQANASVNPIPNRPILKPLILSPPWRCSAAGIRPA
jgi:hypothetical protein